MMTWFDQERNKQKFIANYLRVRVLNNINIVDDEQNVIRSILNKFKNTLDDLMILDYRKSTFESFSTNNDLNARAKNSLSSNFDYLSQQSIDSSETRLKSKRLETSMKSKSSIVVNNFYRTSATSKTIRQSSFALFSSRDILIENERTVKTRESQTKEHAKRDKINQKTIVNTSSHSSKI